MKIIVSSSTRVRRLQCLIAFQLLCIAIIVSMLLHQEDIGSNPECVSANKKAQVWPRINCECCRAGQEPVLIVRSKKLYTDYFENIQRVFSRLGYRQINNLEKVEEKPPRWDLLWMHDYPPYNVAVTHRKTFRHYQKINHFPGIGFLASKSDLLRNGGKFIPAAFVMPEEKETFLNEIQKPSNETRSWIQKYKTHRGWQVKDVSDLDLDSSTIIQEFIQNPFLIDGYKFNIGIYVTLTSVDPLRAYILDADVSNRFCPKKYSHGNYTDVETYVTDIEFPQRIYNMPSLERECTKLAYNFYKALDVYLISKGKDSSIVRGQIYEAVRETLTTRVKRIRRGIPDGLFHQSNTCFELMRWDFLLDEELKLHLIEVNMSPNLHALPTNLTEVAHKEQVLFNSFSVAGVSDIRKHKAGSSSFNSIRDSDINLGISVCSQSECTTCQNKDCFVCIHCMSEKTKHIIRVAFSEHLNRQHFRRAYPEEMSQNEAMNYNPREDERLSANDRLTRAWFRAKCIGDPYWCQ